MSPGEYANLIFDGYCSLLLKNYPKITFKECEELKNRMDYKFIQSFEFPATFDNQKYLGDEGRFGGGFLNGVPDPKATPFSYREVYLNHYGK